MIYPSELDNWYHVDNWIPTEIINDHSKPSYNEYYDINFPFYRDAFVLAMSQLLSPLVIIYFQ